MAVSMRLLQLALPHMLSHQFLVDDAERLGEFCPKQIMRDTTQRLLISVAVQFFCAAVPKLNHPMRRNYNDRVMCQVEKSTPRAKIVLESSLLLLQRGRLPLETLCRRWQLDELYHPGYQHYGGPERGCCCARVPPAFQPVHGFPNGHN